MLSDKNKTVLSQHYHYRYASTESALICISWLVTWEDLHLIVISLRSLVCLVIVGTAVSHNSLPQRICIV